MNESPCQATITTAILSPAPKGQELNFDKATVNINNGRSGLFLNSLDNFEKELKMTKKDLSSSSSSSSIITLKPKSQSLHSYEVNFRVFKRNNLITLLQYLFRHCCLEVLRIIL